MRQPSDICDPDETVHEWLPSFQGIYSVIGYCLALACANSGCQTKQ
jgi:hypothetical protein